ncbi:MAG: LAGLIDADG family homing endonuclease, partial [Bacteroidota bacterium]
MRIILRSLFSLGQDKPDFIYQNYLRYQEAPVEFEEDEDRMIWEYIHRFCQTKNHSPSFQTLVSYFTSEKKHDILDRLELLKSTPSITRGDFEVRLETKGQAQKVQKTKQLLRNAATILEGGMEVGEGRKKILKQGTLDSIKYVIEHGQDLIQPTFGSRLSGEVTTDAEEFKKRYQQIEADPLPGIGQFTGIDQIDKALSGAKRYELWTHAAFTGGLKCVSGDTKIFDLRVGRLRTVREMHEKKELPIVHGLNEDTWDLVEAPASHLQENGIRDILEVQTRTGKRIKVSGNHPFLTNRGWVKAEDLTLEHWVAVPKNLKADMTSCFDDHEVKLLGYLLGDGCITRNISFTSHNPEIMLDVQQILERMGHTESEGLRRQGPTFRFYDAKKQVKISSHCGPKSKVHSPVFQFLDHLGVIGLRSGSKKIPSQLWSMNTNQVWMFLSALWSTDGRVGVDSSGENRKPKVVLSYCSKSYELASDLQLLLQRVGVSSSLT